MQKRDATAETYQDSVSFFHSVITSTLMDLALEAGKEVVSKEKQSDNALSLVSANLLCNPQSNVMLHNNLQKKVGEYPRLTRGGIPSTRYICSSLILHPVQPLCQMLAQ